MSESGMPQLNTEYFASQIFWLIISFIILYVVMAKYALPKIANVITADYDKLVQKVPGTIIKFKLVNLAVAENAFQDYVRKF